MIFGVNYIIHSTTCQQAYSGARNSGFSDYACLRMLQMPIPGFNLRIKLFTLWFNDSILGFNDSILEFNDSILGFNDSLYDSMIQF
jgi:hypothetical protein